MTKVGYIDYYLDEWHANNYKEFFNKLVPGEIDVIGAYGKIDSPIGGISNKEWSEKYNIPLYKNMEKLIEDSDALIVLSPDNSEMHSELSKLPLESKKPTFIDKTFAPDRKTAEEIFELSDKFNTPCYSASAFRFSEELVNLDKNNIHKIISEGTGEIDKYLVHQIDPVIAILKETPKRVMAKDSAKYPSIMVEFESGRIAEMSQFKEATSRFNIVSFDNDTKGIMINSDIWVPTIKNMAEFLKTGNVPVPHKETIDGISVIEGALKAVNDPYKWVNI